MAHRTLKSGYEQLVDRLNRFPQGAPPSDVLFAILKMLFSEREAGLVALLPIKPFTVDERRPRYGIWIRSTPKMYSMNWPGERSCWTSKARRGSKPMSCRPQWPVFLSFQ